MKCLLVIDMQEDYVGESRNVKMYPYNSEKLICSINSKISEYSDESVIYIVNRYIWESKKTTKKLVSGLSVVSDNIFEKRKMSCFSNRMLLQYLRDIKATEIELAGVDGNYCISASAIAGIKNQYKVFFNESLVESRNCDKFRRTRKKLEKNGVIF